uniref:Uncharacterized protein n=2 Tax=unclassified Mycobacterium TaxID=2642494 RepID=A0A5Q5BSV9_MYCSS
MEHHSPPASRTELIGLTVANLACAMVLGLCVALPTTGAAFVVSIAASCLSAGGCEAPTVVEALVPTVATISWAATATAVAAQRIRYLLATARIEPALTVGRR